MPILVKTVNKVLVLTWTNDSRTTEASWKIPAAATDEEKLRLLQKAVGFMELQMGAAAPAASSAMSPIKTAWQPPVPTESSTTTSPTPSPTPGGALTIPMMAPNALSDRPSDGGPPGGATNEAFWAALPTVEVPGQLAGNWEMEPESGGGW